MAENREVRATGVTRSLYQLLLRLLPRPRRDRYGGEMAAVFEGQRRAAGRTAGVGGLGVLWMKEATGMVRFSLREWVTRLRARLGWTSTPGRHAPQSGSRFSTELRWAWRGVRARGWRAVFIVLLLAVAMAANTVVFSAADAFVFNRAPYRDPGRLAVIERHERGITTDYIGVEFVRAWREQRDLFVGVEAYQDGPDAYLTTNGITEAVPAQLVTPGLFELLGIVPAVGRPFRPGDNEATTPHVAIVADALARRLFGTAAAALGQSFAVGKDTVVVLGVMPAGFRFPSAREQIWLPFDPSTLPTYHGVRNVVRVVRNRPFDVLQRAVVERTPLVAKSTRYPDQNGLTLETFTDARHDTSATLIFGMLVGAAGCLLLIACANIASLEFASAARRARTFAIQAALGASRGALVRAGLVEGAVMLTASVCLAALLASWSATILTDHLTPTMRNVLVNPIDLDERAIIFMTAIAATAWLLTSLPVVRRALRVNLVDTLRDDPRVMPVTGASARMREWLMAGQVALTVLLLVGAFLYLRTYAARAGLDKGFDVQQLVYIELGPAPDAPLHGGDLEAQVLQRLQSFPDVKSVARTSSVPPYTQAGATADLKIAGRTEPVGRLKLGMHDVDPEYFATMGIPIVAGSNFSPGLSTGEVIVDERFARQFFPGGDALGQRFGLGSISLAGASEFTIVGVARPWRMDQTRTPGGEEVYVGYFHIQPGSHPLTFVARLDDERHVPALVDMVRVAAPRSTVRVLTLASLFARLDADTRLVASITSGFGVLALLIATAGIYAVMAFLVAGRRREIGIRMALGADRRDVRRLVFSSSLRLVAIGAVVGCGSALVAARWISSQLFGVTGRDPVTYAAVTALVVVTALVATWYPARQAASVDPATTLRAE